MDDFDLAEVCLTHEDADCRKLAKAYLSLYRKYQDQLQIEIKALEKRVQFEDGCG